MLEPRQLHNIAHPFIDSIYLKKEFDTNTWAEGPDVLVIEARRLGGLTSKKVRDELLLSLLADLDLIKDEVESKAGKFSRVDIRCN